MNGAENNFRHFCATTVEGSSHCAKLLTRAVATRLPSLVMFLLHSHVVVVVVVVVLVVVVAVVVVVVVVVVVIVVAVVVY